MTPNFLSGNENLRVRDSDPEIEMEDGLLYAHRKVRDLRVTAF
jgi:hypothetical protein